MTSPRDKALQALDKLNPNPGVTVTDEEYKRYETDCATFIILNYETIRASLAAPDAVDVEALKLEVLKEYGGNGIVNRSVLEGMEWVIDHLASKGMLPTGDGWLPIESAPKLGRILLAAKNPPFGYQVAYGHWWKTYNRWEYDGYAFGNPTEQPDYWRPLPEPPIAAVKK